MLKHGRETMERRETARMLSSDGFALRPRPRKKKFEQNPNFKQAPRGVPTLNYWVEVGRGVHKTIQGELFGCVVVDGVRRRGEERSEETC